MKINEIFYSLQGEGHWTGTPAVFIRFSGCNLHCGFCDTEHNSGQELSVDEIISEASKYPTQHIIFTGGEPTMQLTRPLVDRLHQLGKYLHIETNGTLPLPDGLDKTIDWITVSPKDALVKIQRIDELKVIFHGAGQNMASFDALPCHPRRLPLPATLRRQQPRLQRPDNSRHHRLHQATSTMAAITPDPQTTWHPVNRNKRHSNIRSILKSLPKPCKKT